MPVFVNVSNRPLLVNGQNFLPGEKKEFDDPSIIQDGVDQGFLKVLDQRENRVESAEISSEEAPGEDKDGQSDAGDDRHNL